MTLPPYQRVQLNIATEQFSFLAQRKSRSGTTMTESICDAVALLQLADQARLGGGCIGVLGEDGSFQAIGFATRS